MEILIFGSLYIVEKWFIFKLLLFVIVMFMLLVFRREISVMIKFLLVKLLCYGINIKYFLDVKLG